MKSSDAHPLHQAEAMAALGVLSVYLAVLIVMLPHPAAKPETGGSSTSVRHRIAARAKQPSARLKIVGLDHQLVRAEGDQRKVLTTLDCRGTQATHSGATRSPGIAFDVCIHNARLRGA